MYGYVRYVAREFRNQGVWGILNKTLTKMNWRRTTCAMSSTVSSTYCIIVCCLVYAQEQCRPYMHVYLCAKLAEKNYQRVLKGRNAKVLLDLRCSSSTELSHTILNHCLRFGLLLWVDRHLQICFHATKMILTGDQIHI